MRIADTYWVQLTAFTDSAQVELDDPAVNLDRFPLFFPERRPFFLTGFDAFRFGRERVSQPFFSRRIGLTPDARQAWVYGGAKSFGRIGNLSLGVLDVIAEGVGGVATNHAVLRPRIEIDGPSYVGAIGTVRHTFDQSGSTQIGVSAGLDTLLRTSDQRYELSAFGTFSVAEGASLGWDGELAARHMGTTFQPKLTVAATSSDYNPLLGYVRRSDFVRVNLVAPVVFRGVPRIREIWVTGVAETGLSYTTGNLNYAFGSISADLTGTSEWYFRAELAFTRDTVAVAFDLPGGYNVKPGDYDGASFRLSADSAPREVVAVSGSFLVNDGFFGGTSQTIGGALRFLVAPHLRLSISPSVSFLQFPDGRDHVTTTLQVPFTWTPSTTVQLDGALQLNTEASTFTSLARLRWRYAAGSDAYLVYRQETAYRGSTPADHSVTLKVVYRWDGLI